MTLREAVEGRPVPQLGDTNRDFWTAGARGELRLQRCDTCARLVHPPALLCPHDHGQLRSVALSGRALVETWTVNTHRWFPWLPEVHVVAFVTPVEDERVRLLTNLVDVEANEIRAGMPVVASFERYEADGEDVFVPVFAPERP